MREKIGKESELRREVRRLIGPRGGRGEAAGGGGGGSGDLKKHGFVSNEISE